MGQKNESDLVLMQKPAAVDAKCGKLQFSHQCVRKGDVLTWGDLSTAGDVCEAVGA